MTPEDIEQLRQLKQLADSGVLSAEDFELQKNLILASSDNNVVSTRRRLDEMLPGSDVPRPAKTTSEVVSAAQRAAVRVQVLSYLFALAGIIVGFILINVKEGSDEEQPLAPLGIGLMVNALTLSIILYAFGKYMEARLQQGSELSSLIAKHQ